MLANQRGFQSEAGDRGGGASGDETRPVDPWPAQVAGVEGATDTKGVTEPCRGETTHMTQQAIAVPTGLEGSGVSEDEVICMPCS